MSNLCLNLIPCFDGTSVEKEGGRERERVVGGEKAEKARSCPGAAGSEGCFPSSL